MSNEYRKKPVVIEAIKFDGTLTSLEAFNIPEVSQDFGSRTAQIYTLEGVMTAEPGDWIIRGIKGELYPCKPDIFAATYEEASTPAEQPAPASTARESIGWIDDNGTVFWKEGKPPADGTDLFAAPVAARELDVEAERREPPTLPRYLLDMIGEYGMARSDGVGQVEVQHRWETLIGGIKRYASDFARSAAQGTAPAPSKMLAAQLRYIFELEQKVVALKAKVAAQTESAPVSTEQAGDAWGVGFCGCQACNPHMIGRMMFICATCGDKRCPHAANHVLNCQGRAPSPNNSPVGEDKEPK